MKISYFEAEAAMDIIAEKLIQTIEFTQNSSENKDFHKWIVDTTQEIFIYTAAAFGVDTVTIDQGVFDNSLFTELDVKRLTCFFQKNF